MELHGEIIRSLRVMVWVAFYCHHRRRIERPTEQQKMSCGCRRPTAVMWMLTFLSKASGALWPASPGIGSNCRPVHRRITHTTIG